MTGYRSGKFHNRKTVVDGITFDSQAEAQRYVTLKLMQRKGLIHDLELQVRFQLLPSQKRFIDGKTERKCDYIADFAYYDEGGFYHVEDVKGKRTPEYIIKRKLMLYMHGISIEEIKA